MRALSSILALLCAIGASAPALGQTCSSPLPAGAGLTPFSTTAGQVALLSTAPSACDVSVFGSNIIYNVTWLRFVPPLDGTYVFETCGLVNFDTRMAVLRDCTDPTSCVVGADNTAGCTLSTSTTAWASRATVANAVAGVPLIVGIGTNSSSGAGSGSVRITAAGSTEDGLSCPTAYTAIGAPGGQANTFSTVGSAPNVQLPPGCDLGSPSDGTIHRAAWFRFTPAASGRVRISTCGAANFNTRLAVLRGCETGPSADVVACNDDSAACPGFTSSLTFDAVAGTVYRVVVGGYDASSAGIGSLVIDTDPVEAACGDVQQPCCAPGAGPFCSDGSCCSLVCNEDPFCCAEQWDQFCAQRAGVVCGACGAGQCELLGATSAEGEACGESLNAGCFQDPPAYVPLAPGDVVAGTFWADGDTRDTDWYEFSLKETSTVTLRLRSPGPGKLFLLDGACPPGVIEQTSDLEASCPAEISRCLLPGTYRVNATMSVFDGFPCSSTTLPALGQYELSMERSPCSAVPPANDECADAEQIPDAGGIRAFDTRLASASDPPLPLSCDEGNGIGIAFDLWYRWRPPAGIARVSTCEPAGDAGFDSRLAVYSGCAGTLVACNDDAPSECGDFRSVLTFPSNGTTTYLVRLGGFDSAGTGTVSFEALQPLQNDDCATAIPVFDGTSEVITVLATDSAPPLPAQACDEGFGVAIRKDVWFRYLATCSGTVTVSTCAPAGAQAFDTWLAAYDACGGTVLACNDDTVGCEALTSRMLFAVTAGTEYLLRVGGHSGGGRASLTIACTIPPPPPANDSCIAAREVFAGQPEAFDTTLAADDAPTAPLGGCAGTVFLNDVWFEYRPRGGGLTTIGLCGGTTFDSRLELWSACPSDGGVVIGCDDDGCGAQSRITAVLACDAAYLVRVGSFADGSRGPGVLLVTEGPVDCSAPCRPDLDDSGAVDGGDLGKLLFSWGSRGPADLDGDGIVGGADLGILISEWGPCTD